MASIHKGRTKKGGFEVRWRDLSGGNRRRWCRTRKAAERLRHAIIDAKSEGIDWVPPDRTSDADRSRRLEDLLRAYVSAMRRRWAPRTLQTRDYDLVSFLKHMREIHGPNVEGRALSRSALETYFDSEAKKNARITATNRVHFVESVWAWLANHEDYTRLVPPARTIDLPPSQPELKPWAPTWEEMDRVVLASTWWYARMMTVLRYTGLRISQVMGLLWADLNFDRGLLTIRPDLGKTRQEKKGRVIPVSSHLLRELAGWGRREGLLIDVSILPKGSKPNKKRCPSNRFLKAIWRTGLGYEIRQPTHAMRKGLVTNLRAMGAPFDLVQILVGHSQGVTGDTYSMLAALEGQLREVVDMIPEIGCVQEVSSLDAARGKST